MPSVELLAVGTELLLGQLQDTNTRWIAQELAALGIDVFATHAVGDNRARIAAAVGSALERADGVICSGGLGPTVDDLTKEAVCDALHVDCALHEPSLHAMQARFEQFGRVMTQNNRKQAMMPHGAAVFANADGTAPGFAVARGDGKFAACLPGPPREMRPMFERELIPWLRARFGLGSAVHTRVLHTVGIGESDIDERIGDLFRTLSNPKIAVLAHDFRCDVKIMAKAESPEAARALIAPVEAEMLHRLNGHVFGVDDQTLAGAIHALLAQRRARVAIAESCTGGRVAAALTAVPGISDVFPGAVVAYANEAKLSLLGVCEQTLVAHGAVSEEVAREMAQGARAAFDTQVGVAITGIAGPSGGTEEKPVGLIFLAVADGDRTSVRRVHLPGDRSAVQARATVAALTMLWKALQRG